MVFNKIVFLGALQQTGAINVVQTLVGKSLHLGGPLSREYALIEESKFANVGDAQAQEDLTGWTPGMISNLQLEKAQQKTKDDQNYDAGKALAEESNKIDQTQKQKQDIQQQSQANANLNIESSGLSVAQMQEMGIIDKVPAPAKEAVKPPVAQSEIKYETSKESNIRFNKPPVGSYELEIGTSLKLDQTPEQKQLAAQDKLGSFLSQAVDQKFSSKEYLQSHAQDLNIPADAFEPGKSLSITDMVNVPSLGEKAKAEDQSGQDKSSANAANVHLNEQQMKEVMDNVDNLNSQGADMRRVSPELSGAGFRVELKNDEGEGYVGTIYIGSEEKPVNVLFDTGSDFLAITSDLCMDPKLGKIVEDVPVFNTTTLSYVHSGKDNRKCKSMAYTSKSSQSAKPIPSADDEKLDYGSAKLQGKLFEDNTCIDQNKTSCTDFRFLALYQAEGLDDVDGILGLAVHPDIKRRNLNYVWQLKNKGIIDKALVSFSVSGPGSDEPSFAQFGGIDEEQIVGGVGGLTKMATNSYRPFWTQSVKQWALEGQSLAYAGEECQKIGEEKNFPAIIDTGSSAIGVPEKVFGFLKEKWHAAVPKLNCIDDDNFCQVMQPCDQIQKALGPIQLQISGQTFELPAEQYLHQAEGAKCQFAIHENQMKGSSGNLFVVGDTLLRHLYQVYDFENETISLGVNKHSQGKIMMYPSGKRPEEAPKLQQGVDEMSPEDVKAMNAALAATNPNGF